jgi:hypothetical protein
MPALSVLQPWAWAIMEGIKPVENRTWRTNYRGVLAIQAGLGKRAEATGRALIEQNGFVIPEELPRGMLLGTVELVECLPQPEALARFGGAWVDADPSGWCWVLRNPRRLREPRPCRGKLSLFDVEYLGEELFA